MFSAQRLLLAASSLLCLGLLIALWDPAKVPASEQQPDVRIDRLHGEIADPFSSDSLAARACGNVTGLGDLAIILKTGSSEIYDKLPHHFATTLACGVDYLVYSDLQQGFGPVSVRDALALMSQELRDGHPDLAQYRMLQQHVLVGGDAGDLRGEKSWRLDKWKF